MKQVEWELPLEIEYRVFNIIVRQEMRGIAFDKQKAEEHVKFLTNERSELYDEVRPHLEMEYVLPYANPMNKPFVMSGMPSSNLLKWYPDLEGVHVENEDCYVGGPFTRVKFEEPDIGSRKKLIKQLYRLGWKPVEFTEKGNPKVTEESLAPMKGIGAQLARWYVYQHRQSQIQGWLNNIRPDGRLTAGAFTNGTNTGRFRHKGVVNVPKAKPHVIFGEQMRSLFIAGDGYKMVGHDAEQLELRILAHFMNDPKFIEQILEGDIHSFNQELAGLPTRDDAKTFIYALL